MYPWVMKFSDCGEGISSCPIVKERGPSVSLTRIVSGSLSRLVSADPSGPKERTVRLATIRSVAALTDSGVIESRMASEGGSSRHPSMFAARSFSA